MADSRMNVGEWWEGKAVRLRLVTLDDCGERYVAWLADPEVNRYLETRFMTQTIEMVRGFVSDMLASPINYLFAIVDRASEQHIGNVKIGPVNTHHAYADVSYFLGERASWGRGLGTDACCAATRFAFERLGLHRVQAGFYETNLGSQKVLTKAGFSYEGRLRKKLRQSDDGEWEDHVWFAALKEDWTTPERFR